MRGWTRACCDRGGVARRRQCVGQREGGWACMVCGTGPCGLGRHAMQVSGHGLASGCLGGRIGGGELCDEGLGGQVGVQIASDAKALRHGLPCAAQRTLSLSECAV